MRMQTGPAANQSMRGWLAWTGLLEWLNVALFSLVLWQFGRAPGSGIGRFAILGVMTLNIVLAEGGLYWLLKRQRTSARPSPARRVALLRSIYAGNGLLLLVFPLALLVALLAENGPGPVDLLVGMVLYLFGLGEFVHYFVYKINMRPAELRRAWRERRPVPARVLREYRRARALSGRAD